MARDDILGVEVCTGRVLPEWIDVNNHMNVAYYVLAFDQGVDSLWERFGITDEHIREMNSSTFAVESHVVYRRELRLDEPYLVTAQILAFDEKRIHQFQRLYHARAGFLAATCEWMNLHVDLEARRVTPWPGDVLDSIADFAARQSGQDWPEEAGKTMSIATPLYRLGDATETGTNNG